MVRQWRWTSQRRCPRWRWRMNADGLSNGNAWDSRSSRDFSRHGLRPGWNGEQMRRAIP